MVPVAALLALIALVVALTAPTGSGNAADHLDAPGLTSPDGRTDLDINDVYAFTGAGDTTVLAMTVIPLASTDTVFAPGSQGAYELRIDTNGNAATDIAYLFLFDGSSSNVSVYRTEGGRGEGVWTGGPLLGTAPVGSIATLGDGTKVFAGLRSDPFFFDLSGFRGTVEAVGDDALGDDPTDFFANLNTMGIVIEVPDSQLNDGAGIGVWARTSRPVGASWKQVDRMGRPAINTVVNSSGPIVQASSKAKNLFNVRKPVTDVQMFTDSVVSALQAFSALDTEGAYSDAEAEALASVLLPDLLAFDKSSTLPAPLNGRALADDVIDVELRVITGGDPLGLFPGRDADGGVNGDGVGAHGDYLSVFPYLGEPHS